MTILLIPLFVNCYFSSFLHLFRLDIKQVKKHLNPLEATQPVGYEKGWVHFIPSLHKFTKNPCLASMFSSFFMLIFKVCK
jgi:hypothetical protein